MTAEFYLFDVDHGQSAALRLPNNRWCIFDVGNTDGFSPVEWIARREPFPRTTTILTSLLGSVSFRFLKATVSHFHGDHLADWQNLIKYSPEFIRTVNFDKEYLNDCMDSNTSQSSPLVTGFAQHVNSNFSGSITPNYGGTIIKELSLPVNIARQIGGNANNRVNNASIITRIDIYGNSILLCGDMENDAWNEIINNQGQYGAMWSPFLSNIDILVAPHHGHKTGFSIDLLNLAKPSVVLISVVSKDPNVDSRYSQFPVRGITLNGTEYKSFTTRQKGHIKVTISPPKSLLGGKGERNWTFGDEVLYEKRNLL